MNTELITDSNTITSVWEKEGHFYLHMPNLCTKRQLKDGTRVKIVKIELEVI